MYLCIKLRAINTQSTTSPDAPRLADVATLSVFVIVCMCHSSCCHMHGNACLEVYLDQIAYEGLRRPLGVYEKADSDGMSDSDSDSTRTGFVRQAGLPAGSRMPGSIRLSEVADGSPRALHPLHTPPTSSAWLMHDAHAERPGCGGQPSGANWSRLESSRARQTAGRSQFRAWSAGWLKIAVWGNKCDVDIRVDCTKLGFACYLQPSFPHIAHIAHIPPSSTPPAWFSSPHLP